MIEKPIEWRRFERVELEGEVARTAPRTANVSPVSTPPSLLHEFERVLRENERLQLEIARLRGEAAKSAGRTPRFREELESAGLELARMEGTPNAPQSAPAAVPAAPAHDDTAEQGATSEFLPIADIARIVAGYIFSIPSPARIRLVEDALRGSGFASRIAGGESMAPQ